MSDGLADLWRQHVCRGDFEAAWRISDRALQERDRFARSSGNHESTWRGESLDGKRVLLRCCYGLGDTLQFVRYVPLLRRIARRIIVQGQASLGQLLEHVDGIDSLITRYNRVPLEKYDVALDLTELPHVFRTEIQTIPAPTRYIQIAPRPFASSSNLQVGLVWEGSDWDHRRTIPLHLLDGLERIPCIILHILQRGRALLQRPIAFGIDSGTDDIYEAARTISGLDLMITIDSMPAHLAGALGVPTWILLHSDCDWRWMQTRTDSPWYPTMRLFRQRDAGDWRPVVTQVKQELEQLSNARFQRLSAAA